MRFKLVARVAVPRLYPCYRSISLWNVDVARAEYLVQVLPLGSRGLPKYSDILDVMVFQLVCHNI